VRNLARHDESRPPSVFHLVGAPRADAPHQLYTGARKPRTSTCATLFTLAGILSCRTRVSIWPRARWSLKQVQEDLGAVPRARSTESIRLRARIRPCAGGRLCTVPRSFVCYGKGLPRWARHVLRPKFPQPGRRAETGQSRKREAGENAEERQLCVSGTDRPEHPCSGRSALAKKPSLSEKVILSEAKDLPVGSRFLAPLGMTVVGRFLSNLTLDTRSPVLGVTAHACRWAGSMGRGMLPLPVIP